MKNLKRELELERGIRKELEQAKKLLERECHEREQAVQILRQQVTELRRLVHDRLRSVIWAGSTSRLMRLSPRSRAFGGGGLALCGKK